jgi:flagellar hook-associated protein 1 FlgK
MSTAQSIFNNTGTQSSVVAKNIQNAQNPNYVRRSAVYVTGGAGALVVGIERAQNLSLQRQTIESTSFATGQRTVLTGLTEIKSLLGGNDYENSPEVRLRALFNNLNAYAATPNDATVGTTVVSSAQDVVNTLNTTSKELQAIRKRADEQIKEDVDTLNNLLKQFEAANNKVKSATAVGGDPNDALDERDTVLKQISEIVGVTSYVRENNDMVLYTSEGTTLFETMPRAVTFTPTNTYDAATTGNGIYIDGAPMKAGVGADTSAKGSLQGLLQLRDEIAPQFQTQLDEIARGVIVAFAETGPDGTLTPLTGLFTYKDSFGVQQTAIPASGAIVPGLASRIFVNPAVVPPAGNPTLLRDGGINDIDTDPATPNPYIVNRDGASGFSDLLDKYYKAMDGAIPFDPATGIGGNKDLFSFAADSVGWLEQLRSSATVADETKTAMLSRAMDAYSSQTGVNLDEEMSLLLDIEQSYKAAAKLMAAVDEMLRALMEAA